MPVDDIKVDGLSSDQLWKIASEADNKKYIMSGSCRKEFGNLVTKHLYTVVGVLELKKNGKTYKRLFKMRNPWGSEQYNGPWNDEDTQWTADFKKQANLSVDKSDGVFYMSVEDYPKAFTNLAIVHYRDWKKEQQDLGDVKSDLSYVIDNTKQQDIAVSIDAYTDRMTPATCQKGVNDYYWVKVKDSKGNVLGKEQVSFQYGFGNVLLKNVPVGQYQVLINAYGKKRP